MDYLRDDLKKAEYDGHVWEYGHFGEENNGFSTFGFRQDGIVVRVTSKYEAELFGKSLSALAKPARQAKEGGVK